MWECESLLCSFYGQGLGWGGSDLLKMLQRVSGRAVSTQTSLSPAGLPEAFTDILVKLKPMASFLQGVRDTLNFGCTSGPIKANMHTCMLHVEHLFHRSPRPAQKSNPSLRDCTQSSITCPSALRCLPCDPLTGSEALPLAKIMLFGGAPLLAVWKALKAGIAIVQRPARALQHKTVRFPLPSPGLAEAPPRQLWSPLP